MIDGDIDAFVDPLNPGAPVPQLGLFAKQDVIIPDGVVGAGGDLTFEAVVVADGGGNSDGVFEAQSSVALGTLNFTGAVSVRGENDAISVDLNIFSTRDYAHQPNTGIPFTPFIANKVSWQESNLSVVFPPN